MYSGEDLSDISMSNTVFTIRNTPSIKSSSLPPATARLLWLEKNKKSSRETR